MSENDCRLMPPSLQHVTRLDETPDLIHFPLKTLADTTSIGQWKPGPSSINELRLISPVSESLICEKGIF